MHLQRLCMRIRAELGAGRSSRTERTRRQKFSCASRQVLSLNRLRIQIQNNFEREKRDDSWATLPLGGYVQALIRCRAYSGFATRTPMILMAMGEIEIALLLVLPFLKTVKRLTLHQVGQKTTPTTTSQTPSSNVISLTERVIATRILETICE